MKILALSGSLRANSINSALLRAAARLAPVELMVTVYHGLGDLPLFNPDIEGRSIESVTNFHAQVANADALLIASPEYAHGVTGTTKNALDWLVSFEPFTYKPVGIFNASPRAQHADAALREILKTMSAMVVEEASMTIHFSAPTSMKTVWFPRHLSRHPSGERCSHCPKQSFGQRNSNRNDECTRSKPA